MQKNDYGIYLRARQGPSTWPERISKDHKVRQDDSGADVYSLLSEEARNWASSDDEIDVPLHAHATPHNEKPLQALLQALREPSVSDPKAEEILDEVFALEDVSDLDMEYAFLNILQDSDATPNALINILSACVDYKFVLSMDDSLRASSKLLKHENSFVAVAATQALLHSVEGANSIKLIEEAVQEAGPHSSLLSRVLTKFKSELKEG